MVKVNVKKRPSRDLEDPDCPPQPKTNARFLMRADGSHRVVLNSPITDSTNVHDPMDKGVPKSKQFIFLGAENGQLQTMSMKVSLPLHFSVRNVPLLMRMQHR